jgi:hypothetical protein
MEHWTVTWGMFSATVVLALLTLSGLYLNYEQVASQSAPHVLVYSTPDEARPSLILLVIENVGRGMAYDVRFTSSEPIPCRAFGLTEDSASPPKSFDLGPLSTGIPALGPGSKRVMVWGQYGGLARAIQQRSIDVKVSYRGSGFLTFSPSEHTTVCPLEVRSYASTDATDPDGARQTAKQLKRIADELEQVVSGYRRLHVEARLPLPDPTEDVEG